MRHEFVTPWRETLMDESSRHEEQDDNESRRRNASEKDRDRLRDQDQWRRTRDDGEAALTKREREQRWPIG